MHSLQDIWDKIGVLETQNAGLQTQVTGLQTQNQSLTNLLLSIGQTTGALPWSFATVDSAGLVGRSSSLAFTPGGQPAISYFDETNGDLNYAVFNGSTWTLSNVDNTGFVGSYPSLAFTPGGQPAISYLDDANDNLKYAVRSPFAAP